WRLAARDKLASTYKSLLARNLKLRIFILEQQLVTLGRRCRNGLRRSHVAVEHYIPATNAHIREMLRDRVPNVIEGHGRRHGEAKALQNVFLLFQYQPAIGLGPLRKLTCQ